MKIGVEMRRGLPTGPLSFKTSALVFYKSNFGDAKTQVPYRHCSMATYKLVPRALQGALITSI